ncbi:MAG TPA: ABC transporter ATP-binding protein [Clostridia bacterium]|jgi:ABC-2 type transport system ATP-binding protein|nr:ABC transporter ATP-binding protein [Clostridia bacterium]
MVIETYNLTKQYNGKGGCKEICLSIKERQIFGLLGPNGAGKSTLVKTLVGLLYPTSGQGWIFGYPLGSIEAKKKIGYLPENFRYYEWLTGYDLLYYHGCLAGMDKDVIKKRIPFVFELVGLEGKEREKVKTYSKGMQQRIGIGCALLADPDLLFLDEPTSALDPIGRKEVRDIILRLKDQGKTIFLNSHLLNEVEMICDEVAIINKGSILVKGTLEQLLAENIKVLLRIDNLNPTILEFLQTVDKNLKKNGNKVILTIGRREQLPWLAKEIIQLGGLLSELRPSGGSLEDLFINMVRESGDLNVDHC